MKEEIRKAIGISERELKCLAYLALARWQDDELCYRQFSSIGKGTGLEESQARVATRSLKRKGLVEYEKLFDDDGMIAGSGHCASTKGVELLTRQAQLPLYRQEGQETADFLEELIK